MMPNPTTKASRSKRKYQQVSQNEIKMFALFLRKSNNPNDISEQSLPLDFNPPASGSRLMANKEARPTEIGKMSTAELNITTVNHASPTFRIV
jgi:hypothetical protein